MLGILVYSAGKIAYPNDISEENWNLTKLFSLWHPGISFLVRHHLCLSVIFCAMPGGADAKEARESMRWGGRLNEF